MSRKKFSKRALEKRLEAFGGKCAMCQCQIDGTSGLEWDHVIPLKIGGEDTLDNLQPLCVRDHRLKTRGDVAQIAKATRQRQPVLTLLPSGAQMVLYLTDNEGVCVDTWRYASGHMRGSSAEVWPIHWMPLPARSALHQPNKEER